MKRVFLVRTFAILFLVLACPIAGAWDWGWSRGCFGFAINTDWESFSIERSERIVRIWRGLPAEKAGIREGDQIIEVEGKPVEGAKGTEMASLYRKRAGETLTLKLMHSDGEIYEVSMVAINPPWGWNTNKPSHTYIRY
ncbi:PDZ domain-containing protein [Dyella nitratireducens]|uniref:PDZ domain-containing protein n=1 Tax=Dyella nitratireducens TaxID=1849580 RepID=A0ABQ1FPP9_9GAMM|nr:PDZ domain-containing protein [Dyella nitratireducens]GGA24937.1 hypothetical protein GCM10010981_11780 [Dyella nitratireducens]GLQ43760.1 hypothetical protein GCM10007902_36100 [Dyella nitratireducens]